MERHSHSLRDGRGRTGITATDSTSDEDGTTKIDSGTDETSVSAGETSDMISTGGLRICSSLTFSAQSGAVMFQKLSKEVTSSRSFSSSAAFKRKSTSSSLSRSVSGYAGPS